MRFGSLGGLFPAGVGLDPGAANTLVYVRGRGVVVDEPSLVTVRTESRRIEAVGHEAEAGLGRTPRRFQTARPLAGDRDLFDGMLECLLRQARLRVCWRQYRAAVAVPTRTSPAERLAVAESIRVLGAAEVEVVDQLLAAACGAGATPGTLIVSAGAAVTEAGMVTEDGITGARWTSVAGAEFDAAIAEHVASTHGLAIGERTAERVKIEIGSAAGSGRHGSLRVTGRCMRTGVPRSATLGADEVRAALAPPLEKVAETIAGAPAARSIMLTGGSALLPGLDRYLANACGAPVRVADDPMSCVIRGIGRKLDSCCTGFCSRFAARSH
jgi:rod shape-determining protein MreB